MKYNSKTSTIEILTSITKSSIKNDLSRLDKIITYENIDVRVDQIINDDIFNFDLSIDRNCEVICLTF